MKTLILVLALIVSHSTQAQVTVSVMKNAVNSFSFDSVDSLMRANDFTFDKGKQDVVAGKCSQLYMFTKVSQNGFTETFGIFCKCSNNEFKIFNSARFGTYDESVFNAMKDYCKNTEKAKSISETVNNDALVSQYQKGNSTYEFRVVKDKKANLNYYIIHLKYDWSDLFMTEEKP